MNSHDNRFGNHDLYEGVEKVNRKGYLTELLADRAVEFIARHARDPGERRQKIAAWEKDVDASAPKVRVK
jgi:hypothetical protein